MIENSSNSKCPHCQKTKFEIVTDKPKDSKIELNYLRCMDCKTIITAMETYNIAGLIGRLATELKVNLRA